MKLVVLKEGDFSVSNNKEFTELNGSEISSGLKLAIQPFLVITQKDYILLDTGTSQHNTTVPRIYQNLKRADILPQQITKILISHLHKDHIGGLMTFEKNSYKGNFPNADIYIQQRELDYALTQFGNPSYNFDLLKELSALENLVLLNADIGKISDEISFEVSGGHSPYHQEFWIKQGNKTIFYGGDNLPQSSYLKIPSSYKSDYDGRKAMALRESWKKKASKENWKILFYHDIDIPYLDYPVE